MFVPMVMAAALGCGGPSADDKPPATATEPPPQVVALPPRTQGSDWPQFLGPLGTSVSTEKGLRAPWPPKGLPIVWQQQLGTGYAMPVISKGRLFLFERHGRQAQLSCRHSQTGAWHWQFEYPTDYKDFYGYNNGPRCCPVVDDERVYIFGPEGMLHCLTAADGKLVWKVDTRAEFHVVQNFFGVGSTPVVEGDLLIVQIGGSLQGTKARTLEDFANLKGAGSGVVAFDKRSGQVKYRLSDELASYSSPVLATIDNRRWCFVFARGGLVGFEPATGKVDFHFPWRAEEIESVNASNPVVAGKQVFISETYGPGGALLQVRPGGCEVVWAEAKRLRKNMQCHWMTPIHHDGYLYGCSGRHDRNAELRCLELATGKVMWRKVGLTRTSLLMVDGHFLCLGEEGTLRLLKVNPQEYEEVSAWEPRHPQTKQPLLKEPCWAAPILAHGLLYVRGEDRLLCLELIPRK